jgi:hypothetical protein
MAKVALVLWARAARRCKHERAFRWYRKAPRARSCALAQTGMYHAACAYLVALAQFAWTYRSRAV